MEQMTITAKIQIIVAETDKQWHQLKDLDIH